jgi:hypothetical protein
LQVSDVNSDFHRCSYAQQIDVINCPNNWMIRIAPQVYSYVTEQPLALRLVIRLRSQLLAMQPEWLTPFNCLPRVVVDGIEALASTIRLQGQIGQAVCADTGRMEMLATAPSANPYWVISYCYANLKMTRNEDKVDMPPFRTDGFLNGS